MFGYFQMAWYRNLIGRFCGVVSRSILWAAPYFDEPTTHQNVKKKFFLHNWQKFRDLIDQFAVVDKSADHTKPLSIW